MVSLLVQHFLADAQSTITGGVNSACSKACGSSDISVVLGNITNALIFVVGAVSVIMVIIGGLRYVLANGDPKAAEAGRNTVLYAVIGVAIAMIAYAIVNFVIKRF